VLQFRGENPGAAFRQARETPGVRRVGRVTVGSRTEHTANAAAASPAPRREEGRRDDNGRPGSGKRHSQQAPEAPVSTDHRGQLLSQPITGPRLVRDARYGGERPFANIPKPDRPDPVAPPVRKPKRAELEAAAAAAQQEAAAREAAEAAARAAASATTSADENAASEPAYRIVKSRRKDGSPYLLQRGTWKQQGNKRVFEANWEKGFEVREQAEQHLQWLEQHVSETAQIAQ